jgi:hypothetical protein
MRYDARASWTSWHAFTEEVYDSHCDGFVAAIARTRHRKSTRDDPDAWSVIELPGMTVEVRTAGQG